jgi:hypothetical protein
MIGYKKIKSLKLGYHIPQFLKIVRSQKKLYLNEHSRILTGHPVYPSNVCKNLQLDKSKMFSFRKYKSLFLKKSLGLLWSCDVLFLKFILAGLDRGLYLFQI